MKLAKPLTFSAMNESVMEGHLAEDLASEFDISVEDAEKFVIMANMIEYSTETGKAICYAVPSFLVGLTEEENNKFWHG